MVEGKTNVVIKVTEKTLNLLEEIDRKEENKKQRKEDNIKNQKKVIEEKCKVINNFKIRLDEIIKVDNRDKYKNEKFNSQKEIKEKGQKKKNIKKIRIK